MLKLKSLRFSGIGRFVETQDVDLESLGSLVQVDGQNLNTGGSSGSGKSTVFNALDYLLGLNDLPTTVLQSRLTKDPISVRGVFDFNGKPLLITRNKRGLIIDLDGKVTEGASKLAEEELDKILGMPRDVFRKILHKRQKEGGFFLQFAPKAMYEFMTDGLELQAERKKLEKVEAKISELEKSKNSRQTTVSTLESSLKATQEAILALGFPSVREIHQNVILELKGKYDGSEKKLKEVEEKHKLEKQEHAAKWPIIGISPYDNSKQASLTELSKQFESDCKKLEQAEQSRQNAVKAALSEKAVEKSEISYQIREGNDGKKSAADIASQIKKIRDAICPTCEQNWVTETAKTKEAELLASLAKCKEKIDIGLLAEKRDKEIMAEMMELHEESKPRIPAGLDEIKNKLAAIWLDISKETTAASNHLAKENDRVRQYQEQAKAELKIIEDRQRLEIDQVRGQAQLDKMALDSAIGKLKAFTDASARYETAMKNMKDNEASYSSQLDKARAELKELEENLSIAEELKKAVKTFISCAFDDALEAIGEAATKIIRCIPTMSNATIQFEGTKETKEGKVKEEVNAVISMDGDIGIPIKSLSGGERSSIDLAVDLAVIDYMETTSGKGIDIFILDEPFTGLDTVSIEMALEVLKNSNTNKRLVVVDHNPEVKQMVSNRLVVVRDGATSNISRQE